MFRRGVKGMRKYGFEGKAFTSATKNKRSARSL